MKLIVGLGNPGSEYNKTRHNVGFMVLDNYIKGDWHTKFNGLYQEKQVNGEKVLFVKPLTYMNNSGDCVVKFFNYYNIDINDLLVIQDDLDLEIGKYRLKKNSSSGGHNGIKSIIESLNSNEFTRLKIGIKSDKKNDVTQFVLGKFSKEEMDIINKNIDISKDIIDSFINDGIDKTMNVYNKG